MTSIRSAPAIHLFLLFSFLSTPLAECGTALALCLHQSPKDATIEEVEEPEELDPQADSIRRAWLKKFGDKWGIEESSDAEVICTCTCCGDQCPMGAACCCLSPKYPVVEGDLLCFRGPGCGTQPEESIPIPTSITWVFLLGSEVSSSPSYSNGTPLDSSFSKLHWTPKQESPPPETLS